MPYPTVQITLDGSPLNYLSMEYETEVGNPRASLRITPTEEQRDVVDGARVTCRLGTWRPGAAGPSLYTKCEDARIASIDEGIASNGKAGLSIEVDASDGRFELSPKEDKEFPAGTRLHEVLEWAAEQMGFTLATNLEDVILTQPVRFTRHQNYFAVIASVTGLWEARYFPDSHAPGGATLLIADTTRPLPPGIPAIPLDYKQTKLLKRSRAYRQPINRVELLVYAREPGNDDAPYEEIERPVGRPPAPSQTAWWGPFANWPDLTLGPVGFAATHQYERVRLYREDPEDETRITREARVGLRTVDYNLAGLKVQETIVSRDYLGGSNGTVPTEERTDCYSLVWILDQPTFLRCREQRTGYQYAYDTTRRRWELLWEQSETHGLATLDENDNAIQPLDEASRDGVILVGQAFGRVLFSHSQTLYDRPAGGAVTRVVREWDDIRGGAARQRTDTYPGDTHLSRELPTLTIPLTDDQSIYDDGLRPVVTIDARLVGYEVGKRIVDDHVFAKNTKPTITEQIDLLRWDPSTYPGQLYSVTDWNGDAYYLVVLGERHIDGAAGKSWDSRTVLTCLRLEVAS